MTRNASVTDIEVGIERQSLCDAVKRFNAGLAVLHDHPKGHRKLVLSEGEEAALIARILLGPDPERGEPSSWTLPDLCRFIEDRFGKHMCPQSMSRVVRRVFCRDRRPGRFIPSAMPRRSRPSKRGFCLP